MTHVNHSTRFSRACSFKYSVWGTEVRPHDSVVRGLLKCNCHPDKKGLLHVSNDSQLFSHNGSLIAEA